MSGFCHFGLVLFMVLWQSPDTPVMSWFHVSAASSVLEPCALSSACLVSCWSVVFGSVSVSCRGSDTRCSTFYLFVWVCGLEFARPHALLSTCVLLRCTQFVFLSAACIHVISCAVWHAACVFHWLRAFVLSCLVWTCGLWVFSLAACSCPVLHMAGDLFAGHVLVF